MPEPIRPVYSTFNHATGEWTWGLEEDDFRRMSEGYACSRCLEAFEHWVPTCYVCGEPNVPVSVPIPDEWRKQGA